MEMKQTFLMEVMPSPEHPKTLEQSVDMAKLLMGTGAYSWTLEAARGEIAAAASLLSNLQAGHPASSTVGKTAWLQTVFQKAAYFITWVPQHEAQSKEGDGEEDLDAVVPGTKYGAEALDIFLQQLLDSFRVMHKALE